MVRMATSPQVQLVTGIIHNKSVNSQNKVSWSNKVPFSICDRFNLKIPGLAVRPGIFYLANTLPPAGNVADLPLVLLSAVLSGKIRVEAANTDNAETALADETYLAQ